MNFTNLHYLKKGKKMTPSQLTHQLKMNITLRLTKLFYSLLFVLLFSYGATGQVIIQEVFADGTFTLRNTGATDVDISSYWACNFPVYEQLENLNVECGSLVIAAGDEVVVSGFTSNFDVNNSELGLYINSGFSSAANIVSYVDWGVAGGGRSGVAAQAGIWNDEGAVDAFSTGQSIRYDGDGITASDWSVEDNAVICVANDGIEMMDPIAEARAIVANAAAEANKTVTEFNGANRSFPENYYNFLPSVIELSDLRDPHSANATIPLYEGIGPNGEPTYFIVTEATSIELAREYGAIVSPKLIYGNRPESAAAAQYVDVVDGKIQFKGDVDFSPEVSITPGFPNAFPPAAVQPGAVGDDEYSSLVVLPSGEVINAQIVANATGLHDRINEINIEERWANFQLLDGWEGGDQYYYHLVTDASAPGPAAIELGVYAPRLANLPVFGQSELDGETVLLGFSPNVNGLTATQDGVTGADRQGLGSTIIDGGLDPVNIFPLDTNDVQSLLLQICLT